MAFQYEALFSKLERAIDAHPKLKRLPSVLSEPEASVSRLGCSVQIPVKLIGSNAKPFQIKGDGVSVKNAVENLISHLDSWAEALK